MEKNKQNNNKNRNKKHLKNYEQKIETQVIAQKIFNEIRTGRESNNYTCNYIQKETVIKSRYHKQGYNKQYLIGNKFDICFNMFILR